MNKQSIVKMISGAYLITRLMGTPVQAQDAQQTANPDAGQDRTELVLGYNALESTVQLNDGKLRARLIDNVSYRTGGLQLGHFGLNEMTADASTYFGWNTLLAGPAYQDSSTTPCRPALQVTCKADVTGLTDIKAGVRGDLEGYLGGYGFIDVGAGRDLAAGRTKVGVAIFHGIQPGIGLTLEQFHDISFPIGGKREIYTELQVSRPLGPVNLTARLEMPDLKPHYGVYHLGIAMLLQ